MNNLIHVIGTAIYAVLIGGLLMAFLAIYPAKSADKYSDEQAGQYTCEDVRWAKANLSPQDIQAIKNRMTIGQRLKAIACLAKGTNENSMRHSYPVHDIAKSGG